MTRARSLANLANENAITVDASNKVGINSSIPENQLDIDGDVSATSFIGDGSALTGVASTDYIITGTAATFNNVVNVGTAITLDATSGIITSTGVNVTGVVTATTFLGNVTGNATGLSGSPTITVTNINAADITASGTLTYEDVTNIDSIGIVTARSGIEFGLSGVGGTITATGQAEFTGVCTASSFVKSGGTSSQFLKADGTVDSSSYITSADGGNAATLDSIDSTGFLRSDTADQKTSGTLRFNDNVILSLGTGDDAEFFCNGSDFFLDLNSGINNFIIRDGTTTRFTFDDAGDFTATGDISAFSDIGLKEDIELIPNALDKVSKIRGVTYNRIDMENSPKQSGVIAQEVEEVLPEVVHTNDDGVKSVAYGNMVGLLVEAIKELREEVKQLKEDRN